MEDRFETLKKETQDVIDLIATKQYQQAIEKLADAGDLLDELIDHADDDADLVKLSKYQVLLNQMQRKIHAQ
jgi:molecular chaperone GrpE (heat shock protein)